MDKESVQVIAEQTQITEFSGSTRDTSAALQYNIRANNLCLNIAAQRAFLFSPQHSTLLDCVRAHIVTLICCVPLEQEH